MTVAFDRLCSNVRKFELNQKWVYMILKAYPHQLVCVLYHIEPGDPNIQQNICLHDDTRDEIETGSCGVKNLVTSSNQRKKNC